MQNFSPIVFSNSFLAFSQKVLIFQINGLWICDMYNIIDNISKIFETWYNPFKLREPKLNLLLCGEATNTSIYEAFKHLRNFLKTSGIFVQDPRTFQFRSPRVPKIKLITLNFQPLFGSVVVYCHMDGSILRQRTRGLEESTIQFSFSLGSWEKSQHMNSFLCNFRDTSEALEDEAKEEERNSLTQGHELWEILFIFVHL